MKNMQDIKKDFVLDTSVKLFLEKGIQDVTIKDIAQACGIGEASVYRYFGTKQNIVMLSAEMLSDEVYEIFSSHISGNTGYEIIESFFENFYYIMQERRELYAFISHFDNMLATSQDVPDVYVNQVRAFKYIFDEAYQKGLQDGSVREIEASNFYYASTHSIMSLCKKLACEGTILPDDLITDQLAEVRTLLNIVLYYIKNR